MTMRGWLLLATALGVASAGCSDDAKKAQPRDAWGPNAGGINEDIGGLKPCEREQRFDLDEQTPLGFSGSELLAFIEGRHRFPLSWTDVCDPKNPCVRPRACASLGPREVPGVAGSDTFLTVEVRAVGRSALAMVPEDERRCGSSMRIPVEVSMQSDDGAFSLQFAGEVWDDSGRQAQVFFDDLSVATGSLIGALPEGTRLDLGFGGGEKDYWYFDMYFIDSASSPPLLKAAVAGSCVGEGSRSEYVLP